MAVSECRSAGVATVCGGCGGGAFTDCSGVTVDTVESCLREVKSYFSSLACDAVGHATRSAPGCLASIEASCPVLLGAE